LIIETGGVPATRPGTGQRATAKNGYASTSEVT
jgi:hypothetical protein